MAGKNLLLALALAAIAGIFGVTNLNAQDASCKLVVHMSGFRNAKGDAGVTLFKSPDGWPEDNDKAFKHMQFPIDAASKTAVATFENLSAGTYAFAMIHDENMNHKMDRNIVGWPKEGFGFANNPHVGLSSPPFKDASVNVQCPVTEINVTVQYK